MIFGNGRIKYMILPTVTIVNGRVNALHPFREGNGRTARLYFKQLCSKSVAW